MRDQTRAVVQPMSTWLTSPTQRGGLYPLLPGILVCAVVACAAFALQAFEVRLVGHLYIDALVFAIFLGIAARSIWSPNAVFRNGIAFSAKPLLELAVMLLGASISFSAILAFGLPTLFGIVVTVALALVASYAIARLVGLPRRLSVLIACGNSICGNSAIAAVAPVVDASSEDVAASIAFTAVLGVIFVLALPLIYPMLKLTESQYGTLAGLTVYAVPQVLAATLPVGLLAMQVATLVKLVRVLMLGPIVFALSVLMRKRAAAAQREPVPRGLFDYLPWFILGFLLLVAVRSLGFMPEKASQSLAAAAGVLTVVSMGALGLGVDVRVIGRVGVRVTSAVVGSLVILTLVSLVTIAILARHPLLNG
jgi:uncharacterized integral membrane protein (TIGR00698 family)